MRILAGKGALYAAIALGALTSYLAWNFVNQAKPSAQAAVETTPIVVANAPIPVRTVISPELVRVQQMPVSVVHPQSIHSVDQVIGKVARIAMTGDEPVLTSKLYLQRGESGLAFVVPEGMRALSVNFNEVVGSGGMVTPGDHVDVLGVFDVKKSDARAAAQNSQTNGQTKGQSKPSASNMPSTDSQSDDDDKTSVATLVLQDIEVLAVAQRLEGELSPQQQQESSSSFPVPSASSKPTGNAAVAQRAEAQAQPTAKTATVAVKPEDALKLALAEEKGKIRLALRRAKDDDRPNVGQLPLTAMLAPAQ